MLASCSTALEVALLHETFQKHKEAFSDFIFHARCFVFGVENGKICSLKIFHFISLAYICG